MVIDVGTNRTDDGLVGRRGLRGRRGEGAGDHARARRRGADDDRDAALEHRPRAIAATGSCHAGVVSRMDLRRLRAGEWIAGGCRAWCCSCPCSCPGTSRRVARRDRLGGLLASSTCCWSALALGGDRPGRRRGHPADPGDGHRRRGAGRAVGPRRCRSCCCSASSTCPADLDAGGDQRRVRLGRAGRGLRRARGRRCSPCATSACRSPAACTDSTGVPDRRAARDRDIRRLLGAVTFTRLLRARRRGDDRRPRAAVRDGARLVQHHDRRRRPAARRSSPSRRGATGGQIERSRRRTRAFVGRGGGAATPGRLDGAIDRADPARAARHDPAGGRRRLRCAPPAGGSSRPSRRARLAAVAATVTAAAGGLPDHAGARIRRAPPW